jgi:hypothetical protein
MPAPDPAEAKDPVDPVAGLGGDDGPEAHGSARDGQGDSVADREKSVWAVDDDGDEVAPGSSPDEGVAGGGGEGAGSRKCNHGIGIGGHWAVPAHLYG